MAELVYFENFYSFKGHGSSICFALDRRKTILERLEYARIYIDKTFPRFSPTCFVRRKGLEILICKKISNDVGHGGLCLFKSFNTTNVALIQI